MSRLVRAGVMLAMVALAVAGCGGGAPEIQLAPGEKLTLAHKEVRDLTYKGKNFVQINIAGFARPITIEEQFSASTDSVYADGTTVRSLTFDKYSEVTYSGGQAIFNEESEKMIVGEELWLKLGPKGQIVDWRGLEGVRARDAQGWDQRQSMVLGIASAVPTLPSEPVGPGDRWTGMVEMDVNGPHGTVAYSITNTYCLDGVVMKKGRRCARIALSSDIMVSGERGDESAAFQWSLFIAGEGEGEILFGIDEGYLISSKEETNVNVESTTRRGREEAKAEYSSVKGESDVVLLE